MQHNGLRHFGESRRTRESVAVIGHNKKDDECLVVVLANLPEAERLDLEKVLTSPEAQKIDYVIDENTEQSYLSRYPHPFNSSMSWEVAIFSDLTSGGNQRVFKVPMSDLAFANTDQARVFAGELDPVKFHGGSSKSHTSSSESAGKIVELESKVDELANMLKTLLEQKTTVATETKPSETVVETDEDPVEETAETDEKIDISWV